MAIIKNGISYCMNLTAPEVWVVTNGVAFV